MIKYIIYLLFLSCNVIAQTRTIDSLRKHSLKKDTVAVINLRKIATLFSDERKSDSSLFYYTKSLNLAIKIKNKQQEGLCYKNIARFYLELEDYNQAIANCNKAIHAFSVNNNKKEIVWCYTLLAQAQHYKSDFVNALKNGQMALRISKEIGNMELYSKSLNVLGLIYKSQKNYRLAINAFKENLSIEQTLGDEKRDVVGVYSNLGLTYYEAKNFDTALIYQLTALKMAGKDKRSIQFAIANLNIALTYDELKKYDLALMHYNVTLPIFKELGDEYGLSLVYMNTGANDNIFKNYKSAKQNLSRSLDISLKLGLIDNLDLVYGGLASAEEGLGNYKAAYTYLSKSKKLHDSIFNSENSKQFGDLKTTFEVEKKEAELKLKSDAEKQKITLVANEEKKQQKIIIFSCIIVLAIVCVFSIFLYRRFKLTQKQNFIIEAKEKETHAQKETIVEKQKEILDSIHYAKRIQQALMPNEHFIKKTFDRLKNKEN